MPAGSSAHDDRERQYRNMKAQRTSNRSTFRWLLQIIGRRQWLIFGLLLVQLLLAAQALTQTWMLKQLVDAAVGKDRDQFLRYAIMLILVLLVLLGLQAALRYLREFTHASIENALKKRLFGDLLTRSFSEISANAGCRAVISSAFNWESIWSLLYSVVTLPATFV